MGHSGVIQGVALVLVLVGSCLDGSALAQAPVVYGDTSEATHSAPVIADADTIGRCLCAADTVGARKQALDLATVRYNEARRHAQATQSEIVRLRSRIDPNLSEQLDAYRRLVAEGERADAYLYNTAQPADAAAVTAYNQAVSDYNAQCGGKLFDRVARAKVAETLICPAPPSPPP